jgi:hypothetical protein
MVVAGIELHHLRRDGQASGKGRFGRKRLANARQRLAQAEGSERRRAFSVFTLIRLMVASTATFTHSFVFRPGAAAHPAQHCAAPACPAPVYPLLARSARRRPARAH